MLCLCSDEVIFCSIISKLALSVVANRCGSADYFDQKKLLILFGGAVYVRLICTLLCSLCNIYYLGLEYYRFCGPQSLLKAACSCRYIS